MSFFSNLLNFISGVNASNKPKQKYIFGSIVSGTYTNWKTDPHPTILCLGEYQKNGQFYVHGIQLHTAGGNVNLLIDFINSAKANNAVISPMMLCNYLKMKNPILYKDCYRTYISSLCDFKIVNPGLSNISEQYCYPPDDGRDYFLRNINLSKRKFINFDINSTQLKNNIISVINTVKVW